MEQVLRQSTAVDVLIGPFFDLTDGVTEETGESPAVVLSKNGQALGAKNDATTPVHDASGYHNCELDATDTNTVGTLVLAVANTAGARGVRHEFQVVEEVTYDFLYASGATPLADINTEVDNSMVTYGLDHVFSTSISDTDVADDSFAAQITDAGSTSDYTNYSKTEDSLRAISEKVSAIGSASGGGLNFAAVGADALTDTIDNLGVAVDKSTSPATVGIPVAGHAFLAGHEVFLTGTDSYDGAKVIDSVSTNEVVIVTAFTAETFSSSDTIVSSIKATSIEGVQTTNTFASTVSEDGVYHVIDDDGSNNFTISYRYEVGGGRSATEAVFHGFLNGNNDNALLQAYNFVGAAWETRALLTGQNGLANQTVTLPLLARNTGSSGVDLGVVFLRVTDDTPRGSSNPTLNVDSFLVEAIAIGQTAGYQNGRIFVDTVNGTAGTEAFVNGTADNPSLTWADTLTLSASTGITDFHIVNGSTITLSANSDNFSLFGDNWTLALSGQSIAAAHFEGAAVSGTGSGASASFTGCEVGTVTMGDTYEFRGCGLGGTMTLAAGSTQFFNCHHDGASLPVLDFVDGTGSTTVHMHSYHGGIELQNFGDTGTDIVHLDGEGRVDINSNSAAGTLNVRGMWDINDSGASTTINKDDSTVIIAKFDATDAEPTGVPAVNETPLVKLAYMFMAL